MESASSMGILSICRPLKNHFFETEKNWNSAGSGRSCEERSWIDLERLTHNIWHLSIKNYASEIIFKKNMTDQ